MIRWLRANLAEGGGEDCVRRRGLCRPVGACDRLVGTRDPGRPIPRLCRGALCCRRLPRWGKRHCWASQQCHARPALGWVMLRKTQAPTGKSNPVVETAGDGAAMRSATANLRKPLGAAN